LETGGAVLSLASSEGGQGGRADVASIPLIQDESWPLTVAYSGAAHGMLDPGAQSGAP